MHKTKLFYHIILVTKYRKSILTEKIMSDTIEIIEEQLLRVKAEIVAIKGDDLNHIHMIVKLKPNQSVSMIVRMIKQYTAYYAWQEHAPILRKSYWYNNYFWSKDYFCSTTGDASSETVKKYIEEQGN